MENKENGEKKSTEQSKQELLMLASHFHQQSQELEEKLNFVNSQIQELEEFSLNLDFLINNNNSEILSSLGKGVYLPTTISSKKLFVQVGAGVVVRKTPEEAKSVIKNQISRLEEAQVFLDSQFQALHDRLRQIIEEIESLQNK